ncbi:DEAD/DEAH box helicase [[Mycobacterium] nativiensis]|uniref:DEAD/DEAH box helicase n=1 Tax=[Mycobacterium] nativiensis TaxID=2855503 RepID=A0ABU5XZX5_9MYCO|nr:DEAD/DEAH box helicase [Mycolicibacter sp. MYC340]MEB3033556.1 DEAD/DEAH box helicase [Mycolicibacter sp. MYC340]
MIRLKRILPSIKTSRAEFLHVSDTETNGRELEWATTRWHFDMTDADRAHLTQRAAEDQKREHLVAGILTGTAQVARNDNWLTPRIPLRSHQRVAIDLAKASGALIIGDELGGGKTAMSLGVLEDPAARPALVVIVTGLGNQWLRELNKFYPQLRGVELRTTKADEEFPSLCGPDGSLAYDVLLVNYAKLASWRYHLAGKIRSVIFDEVQEIRRPGTQKYEAAAHISNAARTSVGLSATPVYNFGGEIFAIMDALQEGSLGLRSEFLREWCGGSSPYGNDSGTMAKISVDNPEALRAHLEGRGLFLVRTLEEMGIATAGALPIEQVVPSDAATYEHLSGNAVEMAKLILSQDASNTEKWRTASELDYRLRQATGIAKAPFVADFVRLLLESQQKVVLFGWHRAVYDVWVERLKRYKPVLYTGTESAAAKGRSLDDFINGDSRVLIVSLRSGAGIDGLQHVASTLVFGELDWSPGVLRQCIGRLNRPPQLRKVLAYFCVSNDGSDPVMLDTINIKAMESKRLTGATDMLGAQPTEAARSQAKQLAVAVLERAGQLPPTLDAEQESA